MAGIQIAWVGRALCTHEKQIQTLASDIKRLKGHSTHKGRTKALNSTVIKGKLSTSVLI